nr:pentatricopeptide repeat-containing protein At5g61990, mitochondrial-like [Ipomoea batatas]
MSLNEIGKQGLSLVLISLALQFRVEQSRLLRKISNSFGTMVKFAWISKSQTSEDAECISNPMKQAAPEVARRVQSSLTKIKEVWYGNLFDGCKCVSDNDIWQLGDVAVQFAVAEEFCWCSRCQFSKVQGDLLRSAMDGWVLPSRKRPFPWSQMESILSRDANRTFSASAAACGFNGKPSAGSTASTETQNFTNTLQKRQQPNSPMICNARKCTSKISENCMAEKHVTVVSKRVTETQP